MFLIYMRVAYVLPSLNSPSGWRSHAIGFLGAICHHVEPVLLVAQADAVAAQELFPVWPIYTLPATQGAAAGSLPGLRRQLAARTALASLRLPEVDLVHSLEAYPTGLVGHWLARKLGVGHVLTAHGTYAVIWYAHLFDRLLYRQVLRRASLVCPVSSGTADLMRRYFGPALAHARVQPILNGNHFTRHVPPQVAFERQFPVVPTLLSVGDLKPRKGQALSLAAFAQARSHIPQARYFLAGGLTHSEYARRLRAFVQEHGLEGSVSFLGALSPEDLARCYQGASLFVLTPRQEGLRFEGFGLVYLEAGAYGLPVVATRSGGVPEAVKDGQTGILVEPDDVAGAAEAILRLLSDPELARRLGRQNRLWAESLTWERTAREQHQAYCRLLDGS